MEFIREFIAVVKKEMLLEWKQKFALNGLLLYVLSMVVVIVLVLDPEASLKTRNIIFWIILLFAAINAIAKSFIGEQAGQLLYMYGLASPAAIISGKILYNTLLLIFLSAVALIVFGLLGGLIIKNLGLFILSVLLGCLAFSVTFTLMSSIASKAENKNTLMAVLSFPIIVPMLLSLIRLSEKAMKGATTADMTDNIVLVAGISTVLLAVSVILFPFVWRD